MNLIAFGFYELKKGENSYYRIGTNCLIVKEIKKMNVLSKKHEGNNVVEFTTKGGVKVIGELDEQIWQSLVNQIQHDKCTLKFKTDKSCGHATALICTVCGNPMKRLIDKKTGKPSKYEWNCTCMPNLVMCVG